jgi:gp16 family phage-associated protein
MYKLHSLFSNDQLERVRLDFYLRGQTVTDWAEKHQFPRDMVYAVLNGRSKAYRGQANSIAKKLGLLEMPSRQIDPEKEVASN